jgi:hypothetical protein
MIIPNDARVKLYGLQVICAGVPGLSYVDRIWQLREEEAPRDAKPKGAWPFVRACDQSNVHPLRKAKVRS